MKKIILIIAVGLAMALPMQGFATHLGSKGFSNKSRHHGHPQHSYYVCHQTIHQGYGRQCTQCSGVKTFNEFHKYVNDQHRDERYYWRYHPMNSCARLGFAPDEYRGFNTRKEAENFRSKNCSCKRFHYGLNRSIINKNTL